MTHEEKIRHFIADMDNKGVARRNSAPPLYRLLWRMGVRVPPPLFAPTWVVFISGSVFGGVFYGVFMWLLLWRAQNLPPFGGVLASGAFGISMGAYMSWYFGRQRRKLGLPKWSEYPRVF